MNNKENDIKDWPKSWACEKNDYLYGKKIIKLFIPFINLLKDDKLTRKTINTHIDNLWLLGGFLIKHINNYSEDRKIEPHFLITHFVDSWDGPNIIDLSEYEQESFNRTCRKFYKYLVKNVLRYISW